jgi:hypothetical protein
MRKAIRAVLGLWLLSAPALVAAQEPALYTLPPPRVTCDAASGLVDQAGNVLPGPLRRRCDAVWSHSVQNGGVGSWRYEDFISQCAQSCAAPRPLSQASNVTQLNTLGTQAAQSAAGGASGAGAGSGYSTALLVGGGIAGAIGIGVALSSGSKDKPASP